jgi:FkbM family methyltransferase
MALLRVERYCDHSFVGSAIGRRSVVVDLGVNKGEFATWIAERFGCPIYGAEPDPDVHNELAQRSDVTVLSCAVGGRNESAVLRGARGKCSTLLGGGFEAENRFAVKVLTFEEFLSRVGLADRDRIDLVKVDIEGAEVPMFEQAPSALLQRVVQFTVEFHDSIWPELSGRVNSVKSHLRCLGFRVINFSLDNTDVLFVNRKLLEVGVLGEAYLRTIKYANGIRRRAERLQRSA